MRRMVHHMGLARKLSAQFSYAVAMTAHIRLLG